jgi:hypothetical protein
MVDTCHVTASPRSNDHTATITGNETTTTMGTTMTGYDNDEGYSDRYNNDNGNDPNDM